jgi:DNA-binding NarL/FixJ family response regulator
LSIHESHHWIHKLLGAGARGYILKADAGRHLITAVKALVVDRTFFTPKVAQKVMHGHLDKAPKPGEEEFSPITGRQREVLQLLAEGKSSKEVANILGISFKTAETHRANLMRKLNCHSLAEIVRYAIRNQIVEA